MDSHPERLFPALLRIFAVLFAVLFLSISLLSCGPGEETPPGVAASDGNNPGVQTPGTQGSGAETDGSGDRASGGTIPVGQLADLNGDVTDLALHPDGDILVAGSFTAYGGQPVPHVIKLRPDGSLAAWTLGVTLLNDLPVETAVAPDGKVWITQRQASVAKLWRVNANGSLDSGFPSVEFLFDEPGNGGLIFSEVFQLEPIGNGVYAAGTFTKVNGESRRGIVRILETGQLDSGFNAEIRSGYRVAPSEDGTIYVTNYERLDISVAGSQILYRLNANGSRVGAFTPVNVFTVGFNARIFALAHVSDGTNDVLNGGRFVLDYSGSVNPLFDPTAFHNLARINPDGSRDREQPRPRLGTDSRDTPEVLAIAKTVDGTGDFLLTAGGVRRFQADGKPAAAFQVGQVNDFARADKLLCLPDGDTIVGGTFTAYNGTSRGHIVRINRDGSQN